MWSSGRIAGPGYTAPKQMKAHGVDARVRIPRPLPVSGAAVMRSAGGPGEFRSRRCQLHNGKKTELKREHRKYLCAGIIASV